MSSASSCFFLLWIDYCIQDKYIISDIPISPGAHIAICKIAINIFYLVIVDEAIKDSSEYADPEYPPVGAELVPGPFQLPDAGYVA